MSVVASLREGPLFSLFSSKYKKRVFKNYVLRKLFVPQKGCRDAATICIMRKSQFFFSPDIIWAFIYG